jgi:uroporphyrinogen III methyltransferase/synthase
MREQLAWLERSPLWGRTVVVTRARAQASELAERLRDLGARVIEAPSIRIEPRLDDPAVAAAARRIAEGAYDLVCLTSPNGANVLLDAATRQGLDARAFAGTTIAAIGAGTASALATRGLEADVVPERSIAEALLDELSAAGVDGKRALVARAAEARNVLPEGLRKAGADVEVVALYDTVREELGEAVRSEIGSADYVTFTSSSTVRNLLAALGGPGRFPSRARVVSIGPVTSATAREVGLEVAAEAQTHDLDGLVTALLDDALQSQPAP